MLALASPMPIMSPALLKNDYSSHALLARSRKPIDFGNDGTSASLSLAGRFLSIHVPHPRHGMMVIAPYEQFPPDKFYDPSFVRQYRARPLKLLADPDAGFGLNISVGHQRTHPSTYEYVHAHAPRLGSTIDQVQIDSLYVVLPSGAIVQSAQLRNLSTSESRQVIVTVDGRLSLNRASYAQLTEGGPIPMPPAGTVARTTDDGRLVVENEHLPARLDVALKRDGSSLALQHVKQETHDSTLVSHTTSHTFTLPPGASTTITLSLFVSASSSATSPSLGSAKHDESSAIADFFATRGSLNVAALADMYADKHADSGLTQTEPLAALAFATARNVEYLLGLCSIPMGSKGTCIITDHQCLPLGWNRDNYYQLGLLRAIRPHLNELVPAHALSTWRSRIDLVLREHLVWVFTAAERPKGYWGRSYLAIGTSKDDIFQLDQQCYPLLELSEWALDRAVDPSAVDARRFVESVLRTGVVDEVLDAIMSHRWTPTSVEHITKNENLMLFKTEETPGDDAVVYPYHFSSHVLLWRTLDRLGAMLALFPQLSSRHNIVQWASDVHRDTLATFLRVHPETSVPMFAYLASTTGEFEWYHDANDLPTALAPSWGFCASSAAQEAWSNTMSWAFSRKNDRGFFPDGRFAGLGSVHTTFPWPLGDAQELIWARESNDEERKTKVQNRLAKIVQWDGLWSEAVDGETGTVTSKHWFGWPGCFIGTVLLGGVQGARVPPQIDVYVTSVLLSAQLRGKHDRVQRYFVGARVPFSTHDVASSEEAKLEWKRRNRGNNELPCIIVNGEPVGTIQQLDEAVEFGELRQFLRLDEPSSSSSTTTTVEPTPPPPPPSSEKPPALKATLDDFASLSLTSSELAELEAELSSGQTFSLPDAAPPRASSHGFATRVHEVAPLKLHRSDLGADGKRIDYKRVGDYLRPLRQDASTDLAVLDGVDEDELEKLARELEEEESRGKPTLPPKDDEQLPESAAGLGPEPDSVEGTGGAALSKPLDQIQRLDLSPDEVKDLAEGPKELQVEQPGRIERAAVEATEQALRNPVKESLPNESVPIEKRSKRDDVETLKKGLNEGRGLERAKEIEVEPGLGVPTSVVGSKSEEAESEEG